MSDVILVLNAGSSSIKFSVFRTDRDELEFIFKGQIEGLYTAPRFTAKNPAGESLGDRGWPAGTRVGHDGAIDYLIGFLRQYREDYRLVAVGHRVVHGGLEFGEPTLATPSTLEKLERLVPLAPLHQPHNLTPIRIVCQRRPELPQVACFDTAFHRSQPELAQAMALPTAITERGVRRYGFHGLSYEYIAGAFGELDAKAAAGRVVVAHLGNGASMCAMRARKSVATTMGFTAVDGLPMGTRCGAIDPGVMLYLMDEMKMDARAIEKLIYQQSGMLGVSGVSSDMRSLLSTTNPRAQLAVDLFVYRIGRELGSLAAALGGLDALVFTGGIGEHSAELRARVCRGAAWLGVELCEASNAGHGPRISTLDSSASAWTIPTNEELTIARHTRGLVGAAVAA
jgi:acetate kinase